MTNESSPHIPLDEEVRLLLKGLSECRESTCPVVAKHPRYPVPDTSSPLDLLDGPVGCLPVVPTWLPKGRVMILGMYPTCRFATIGSEKEIPIRDIDEPFENSRYFDGYGIRNVRSGHVLYENYLEPLGLDPEKDLWITNMVKCFLFKPEHLEAYENIGWSIPDGFEATRTEKYFDAAKLCIREWLGKELGLCRPQLVIALGEFVCRMIFADEEFKPASKYTWHKVRGQHLPDTGGNPVNRQRHPLFQNWNIFCLHHPAAVRKYASVRKLHEKHISVVKAFVDTLQLD